MTEPRVYVACGSHELPRATSAMAALRAHGVAITHDWTGDVATHGSQGRTMDWRDRARISDMWRRQIQGAHVVLALMPIEWLSEGLAYELGVAHTLGRTVVTAHPGPVSTMRLVGMSLDALVHDTWIHLSTDSAAIDRAVRIARRKAGAG